MSLDGVELDDEEDDGVLLEDDGLALEPLVDESLLLELELGGVALLLLELGGVVLLELELLGLVVLGLVLMDPELEPLLEDGLVGVDLLPMVVELELDDGEVASREAPVLEPGPLLQPYRLPTATAIGRTTSAVFFRILMDGAPRMEGGLRRHDRCKEWTRAGLYEGHPVYG